MNGGQLRFAGICTFTDEQEKHKQITMKKYLVCDCSTLLILSVLMLNYRYCRALSQSDTLVTSIVTMVLA